MDDKKYFKAAVNLKNKLPDHAHPFFDECLTKYSASSIYEYFKDLYVFYTFLTETMPSCKDLAIRDIDLNVIGSVEHSDITRFQDYIAQGHTTDDEGNPVPAGIDSVRRKLTILRNYYAFLCSSGMIEKDPTENIMPYKAKNRTPKDQALDNLQLQELIDAITNVKSTSYHSKLMAMQTAKRDVALVTLIFNTGLLATECACLDVSDVDFENNTLSIRKNNAPTKLYHMNDVVKTALRDYMDNERTRLLGNDKMPALFISLQRKRINVASIKNMIKKYGKNSGLSDQLTPTVLRESKGSVVFDDTSGTYKI